MRTDLIFTLCFIACFIKTGLAYQRDPKHSSSLIVPYTGTQDALNSKVPSIKRQLLYRVIEYTPNYLALMVLNQLKSFNNRVRTLILDESFDVCDLQFRIIIYTTDLAPIITLAEGLSWFPAIGNQLNLARRMLQGIHHAIEDLRYCKYREVMVNKYICDVIGFRLQVFALAESLNVEDFGTLEYEGKLLTIWNSVRETETWFYKLEEKFNEEVEAFKRFISQTRELIESLAVGLPGYSR